jgi:hypothetical protein
VVKSEHSMGNDADEKASGCTMSFDKLFARIMIMGRARVRRNRSP